MHTNTLELVRACEERIVNAWPSVETFYAQGCVIRMADGYSGRANALSALVPGTSLTQELLDWSEALYRRAGLPPRARVTPLLAPGMAERLAERGYVRDSDAIGMIANLGKRAFPDATLALSPVPTHAWVQGICARQSGSKLGAEAALMAIVSRIRLPAAFMTLQHEGEAIGFGMAVVERGMAEIGAIIVDQRLRGKGMARKLVSGLMDWAAQAGAAQAYLQVEPDNAHAVDLYASLGFQELYRYQTLKLET